jgi:PAS domain S-box-containing protein
MKDEAKTKKQLIEELADLRQRIAELKAGRIEAQRAEEQLRQLATRHEAILSEIPDIIMEVDTSKVYTWANPAGYEFFGSDVIGKEASFYSEGEQETYAQVQPLFNGDPNLFYVESWQRRRDGQRQLLAWWCRALKDAQGRVTGALSTARDITDLHRTEQAIRDSEERYRAIMEQSPDGIFLEDIDRRCLLEANVACQRMLGYSPQEITGLSIYDIVAADRDDMDRKLQEILTAHDSFTHERQYRRKDGSLLDVWLNSKVISFGGKKVNCTLVRDLTARKRAEEALRQSNEFVEVVFNSINDCLCVIDTSDFRIVGANRVFLDKYMGEEDLIGRPCYEVTHHRSKPCEPPNDLCPLLQTLRTGSHSSAEHIHYDKLGVEEYFEVLTSPIRNEKGEIDRVVHITRDLTERKRAEKALRESEVRYRTLVKDFRDTIYISTPEGKFLDINQAGLNLFGYSYEEIMNLNVRDLYVNPAERSLFVAEMEQKGYARDYELRFRTKDGRVMDCLLTAVLYRDEYGNPSQYRGIVHDISERKRTEEVLRESEERYRAVMEQSADGIYLVDVETKRLLEANPAFAQMLGYTTEEIVKLSIYDFVDADRRNIDQRFQDILSMEGSVASERQYRRKDGALLDVWVSVNVISYRGRKVMCTIARDITERKRAGEEREKLIGELTEALNNIKTLRGLIPICASCKKIRDDQGYWQQVEVYVRDRSEAEFSHGLCPDCVKEFLSPINDRKGQEKE